MLKLEEGAHRRQEKNALKAHQNTASLSSGKAMPTAGKQ